MLVESFDSGFLRVLSCSAFSVMVSICSIREAIFGQRKFNYQLIGI